MVRLADRGEEFGFAPATNDTSELPAEPLEVMVSQLSELCAVHVQTDGATTPTEPLAPDAGTLPARERRL
jgi:hypothetical protein